MPRTTADKKDFEIKLRINAETKRYLEERTKRSSTISEYVRKLIEKDKAEQFRLRRMREL